MHHAPAAVTTAAPHSHVLLNRIIPVILRSPVHGRLSKHLMRITYTGPKTERRYTIPVSYNCPRCKHPCVQ